MTHQVPSADINVSNSIPSTGQLGRRADPLERVLGEAIQVAAMRHQLHRLAAARGKANARVDLEHIPPAQRDQCHERGGIGTEQERASRPHRSGVSSTGVVSSGASSGAHAAR